MENKPLLGTPKEESKLNIRNLVIGNLVVVLYNISSYFHNPMLAQYLYNRVSLEVFGNHTGDSASSANVTCYSNKSSEDYILQERAQEMTARQQMFYSITSYSANLIGSLFLGSYTDVAGRKMLFILPAIGDVLRDTAISIIIHWNLNLNWYFIGEVLSGSFTSANGIMIAAYAYTADNTPPTKTRTIALAVVDTSRALAISATYIAGGYFIQDMGYFYPSLLSAVLMLLTLIFAVCFIQEASHIKRQKENKTSLSQAMRAVGRLYFYDDTCKTRSLLWLGYLTYIFYQFSSNGSSNLNSLFVLNLPFCWTPEWIGYFSTGQQIVQQILGIPLIKLLHCCVGDEVIGVLTSFTVIGSDILHGLATTDWMMYGFAIASSFSFAVLPVVRAIMSRITPRDRQGSLFTSLCLADNFTGVVGTPTFSIVYQQSVDFMRGLIFFVFAGTHVISTILLTILGCLTYHHGRSIQHEQAVTIQEKEWTAPNKSDPVMESTEI